MKPRIFTLADQLAFAELSGDNNPVHIDPLAARRSLFGEPIVHGIHMLMWGLDQWLEGSGASARLQHLRVGFAKAIGLDREVRLALVCGQNSRVQLNLLKDDEVAVRAVFEWSPDDSRATDGVSPELPPKQAPRLQNRQAIQSCNGSLDLYLQPGLAGRLFPNLTRLFCPVQSAVLLGMTRLVGVECPGQQSIFSKLTLKAAPTGGLRNIKYGVSQFGDRHSLVLMEVTAPGLSGTVEAVLRPEPQAQTSFRGLEKLVNRGEFAGQLALVAGGSRGLGEVTAKLLAAGGAFVRITYHKGKADAQKVVDDILAGGGRADCCELDILHPQDTWHQWAATTHLYYFASPFISASGKHFSPSLFNDFCNYYVSGFAGLVESLQEFGLQNVFYPSTVFIDELPADFAEYALTKSAGELLCRAFAKKYPGMRFYFPRLPKMATDQTVSLRPAQNPDPAPILLTALQNFRDSSLQVQKDTVMGQ